MLELWARLFMDSAEGKPRIRTAHEGTYKIPKPKTHHQDPNAFMSTLGVLGVGSGFCSSLKGLQVLSLGLGGHIGFIWGYRGSRV